MKALEIKENEDGECAEPSLDGAKEGTYPLARPLYVYPSEEALGEEEVSAFMEFYIENSSSDWIAEEVGYVPANQDIVDENMSTLEEVAGN